MADDKNLGDKKLDSSKVAEQQNAAQQQSQADRNQAANAVDKQHGVAGNAPGAGQTNQSGPGGGQR